MLNQEEEKKTKRSKNSPESDEEIAQHHLTTRLNSAPICFDPKQERDLGAWGFNFGLLLRFPVIGGSVAVKIEEGTRKMGLGLGYQFRFLYFLLYW